MQEVNTIKNTVKQIEQHEQGLFRLGCLNGYNVIQVCTAVNELLAAHENMNIEILWGEHDELLAKLQQQELEMVICDIRPEEDYEEFVQHSLSEELPEKEKELFANYVNAHNEFSSLNNSDSFISGFKLGARFVYDTFVK